MDRTEPLRRANHWVPAGYLAAFSSNRRKDGLLYAYRRRKPEKPIKLPPTAVAKENYLYVVRAEGRAPDDTLEKIYAEYVEAPFFLARNNILYGPSAGLRGILTSDMRKTIALYLAHQQLRTPYARDLSNWLASFDLTFTARSQLADIESAQAAYRQATGGELHREVVLALRDAIEAGALVIEPDPHWWLVSNFKHAGPIADLMQTLHWRIVESVPGVEFPTCDTPLVMVRRGPGEGQYRFGCGWREPGLEVTITLGPRHVLVIAADPVGRPEIGSDMWCREVRRRTVENAQEWAYSRREDPEVAELLAMSDPPTFTIEFDGVSRSARGDVGAVVREIFSRSSDNLNIHYGPKR